MNYYELLEISPNASDEVIKTAYKALVKKYHPDSYKGDLDEAQRIMADINQAYEVLSDREKRAAYDEMISLSHHSSAEENAVPEQTKASTSYRQNPFPKKRNSLRGLLSKIAEGIKGIFETILGIVILYLVIGLITGNLSKWNSKIVTIAQDGFFFVSSLVRASHTSPSYEDGSAEYAIDQYIQALFEGDLYTAKQLIDSGNEYLMRSTEVISDTFRMGDATEVELAFLTDDMKNADYKIVASSDGSYYVVFQTYDYQVVYEKTMSSLSVYSTVDEALRTMKIELYKAKKNLKYGVVFQMSIRNGKWIITDIQERADFLNALTGNLYKMLKGDQGD